MALPDLSHFASLVAEAARSEIAELTEVLRSAAPVYHGPDPRRQPTAGAYARSIAGEVTQDDTGVQIVFTGAAPLTDWIIGGTTVAGPIVAQHVGALMFYGAAGGIFFRKSVRGHTVPPNPFYEQALPTMREFESRIVDLALARLWLS